MAFTIEFKPRAIKDLEDIRREDTERILRAVEGMQEGLVGDVKKLTNSEEYRLRVGHYRVLFAVDGRKITVYRVRHRRDAYRP